MIRAAETNFGPWVKKRCMGPCTGSSEKSINGPHSSDKVTKGTHGSEKAIKAPPIAAIKPQRAPMAVKMP